MLRHDGFDPLLIETNTDAEYWQKGASLLGTDPLGQRDVALPATTRLFLIAGSQLSVNGSATAGTTTTTAPTGPTTTTTTTIPGDVYTNTETEPWNPSPCTLGQPTQSTPTPTAHEAIKKK